MSEFVGVALFATSLIWIVALATYLPSDPVWFFSTGIDEVPSNFAGRVGAFLAELSFQLAGYAAYMLPAGCVVAGWHYFWCRHLQAAGTKAAGRLTRPTPNVVSRPSAPMSVAVVSKIARTCAAVTPG